MFSQLEPKCFCAHPLTDQRRSVGHNSTLTEIICETPQGLQPSGSCAIDEYCVGLNTLDDAVCGNTNLCTKKGMIQHEVMYWKEKIFIDYSNVSLICSKYSACFNETNTDRDCGETCIEEKEEENSGNGDDNGNNDEENCVKNECGRCGIKEIIV